MKAVERAQISSEIIQLYRQQALRIVGKHTTAAQKSHFRHEHAYLDEAEMLSALFAMLRVGCYQETLERFEDELRKTVAKWMPRNILEIGGDKFPFCRTLASYVPEETVFYDFTLGTSAELPGREFCSVCRDVQKEFTSWREREGLSFDLIFKVGTHDFSPLSGGGDFLEEIHAANRLAQIVVGGLSDHEEASFFATSWKTDHLRFVKSVLEENMSVLMWHDRYADTRPFLWQREYRDRFENEHPASLVVLARRGQEV